MELINGHAPIKRLLPRHFQMLDMYVAGMSQVDIAEKLGVSAQLVNIVIRSPLFQMEAQKRTVQIETNLGDRMAEEELAYAGKARSIIEQAAPKAARIVEEMMSDETVDAPTRLRAASSLLDRALGKADAPAGNVTNVQINGDIANLLITALQESDSHEANLPTNREATRSSEGRQSHVHGEAVVEVRGNGHREAFQEVDQMTLFSPELSLSETSPTAV